MNNNSIKLFAFSIAALANIHIDTHAAAPASASSSSSSNSNRLALPILTPAQKEKLDAFKKHSCGVNIPTTESISNLVIQDNIHPDYIRYRFNDADCALGWAIEFSRNLVLARYLLEHGANPNSFHTYFYTHVLLAARSVKAAQLLLEHGADPQACAKDLLPNTVCYLGQRDSKLITFYIKHGVDPDLTGGVENLPPMCTLSSSDFLKARERECAQYLIEGGVSLSYKVEDGRWKDYTSPLMLKEKLLDNQESAIRNRDNRILRDNYTDTQTFIVHVKQLADNRRKNIHALVAQHLPVANKNKINGETLPLADLVTDYYEPEFDQMYNKPFPTAQAASSSSSSSQEQVIE